MAKQTRAIVIIFNGEEPSSEHFALITQFLVNHVNATGETNNFTFDAKDIAKFVLGSLKTGHIVDVSSDGSKTEKTPEEEAIIYVGTIMAEDLKKPFNGYELFSTLVNKMTELRTSAQLGGAGAEAHKQFMNALFILSQENLVISNSLMRKYHFSSEKIATIKKVYNFVTNL